MQDADTAVEPNDGLTEALASIPDPVPAVGDGIADKGGDDGQPRDEQGRFAGKEKSEPEGGTGIVDKAPDGDKSEDDRQGWIPAWRHKEIVREKAEIAAQAETERQELQRFRQFFAQQQHQQREAQEAPQRPDPINDPEAFADYLEQRAEQREQARYHQFRNDRINLTFAELEEKMIDKGEGEVFTKAFAWLEKAPQNVRDEVIAAVNPARAMLRDYKRQAAMSEVGDDLEGYHKKLWDKWKTDPERRKEFMADLDAEARGSNGADTMRSSTNVTSLPSLNRAPGGGNRQTPGDLGSTDKEIYENLTRKRG